MGLPPFYCYFHQCSHLIVSQTDFKQTFLEAVVVVLMHLLTKHAFFVWDIAQYPYVRQASVKFADLF